MSIKYKFDLKLFYEEKESIEWNVSHETSYVGISYIILAIQKIHCRIPWLTNHNQVLIRWYKCHIYSDLITVIERFFASGNFIQTFQSFQQWINTKTSLSIAIFWPVAILKLWMKLSKASFMNHFLRSVGMLWSATWKVAQCMSSCPFEVTSPRVSEKSNFCKANHLVLSHKVNGSEAERESAGTQSLPCRRVFVVSSGGLQNGIWP